MTIKENSLGSSDRGLLYPQERFRFVELSKGSFWDKWRQTARNVTAPTQLALLKSTGRYKAFDLQWQEYYAKPMDVWPVPQHLFWESDVAKFLEAACYLLIEREDAELRAEVDYLVSLIESAQQSDGYLNIHFVVCEPEKRWTNLRDLHELYNAGHLIEAAVAHFQLTRGKRLVNVMLRFIRYIAKTFGPGPDQKHGYPGHPEIELALVRLYNAINDKECLDLAEYFVRERGKDGGRYFREEQRARNEHPQLAPAMMPKAHSYWYMQAHKPIHEQETIEGHSVRAMYLLTAVADICIVEYQREGRLVTNKDIYDALKRLWLDCCSTKTSVTGGIGIQHQWEGFSLPYILPHAIEEGGSYNETCASIGQLMLADRLQILDDLNGPTVGDIAERVLYNASLTTGMSIDGNAFTYDNALASCKGHPCERHTWFECACCPPNVLRSLVAVAGYFWSQTRKGLAIHHYFDGKIKGMDEKFMIEMQTEYPWDGKIRLNVNLEFEEDVLIRIPHWAMKHGTIRMPGEEQITKFSSMNLKGGYLTIRSKGIHSIDLCIRPRLIYSHPYTNRDLLTVAYGPLIYCLEDLDNPFEKHHFKDLTIADDIQLTARKSMEHGDIIIIEAKQEGCYMDLNRSSSGVLPELDTQVHYESKKFDLTFVPYFYRSNRKGGSGQMRCSLRRRHEFSWN